LGVGLVVGYSDDEGDIVGLLLLWVVVAAASRRAPVSIRRKLTFDGAKPSPVPPRRASSPRALAEPKEASESKEASSEELNPKLPPPPPRLK